MNKIELIKLRDELIDLILETERISLCDEIKVAMIEWHKKAINEVDKKLFILKKRKKVETPLIWQELNKILFSYGMFTKKRESLCL